MHPVRKEQAFRHKIEELDLFAGLCRQLRVDGDKTANATRMLDSLGDLLGADSAVFRTYSRRHNRPYLDSLVSHGVPATVTETYLENFKDLDPAMALLGNLSLPSKSMPYGLDGENDAAVRHRENFIRYRDEFLVPNHLYHHIGFVLAYPPGRYLLFNFHRDETASAFGPLEQARVRLMMEILQGRSGPFHNDGTSSPSLGGFAGFLSDREQKVVRILLCGCSNKQIAGELGISVRTVENHLRRVYRKLGITSRMQLVALLQD